MQDNGDDMNLPHTRLHLLAKASTIRTLTYDHTVWVHHTFTYSSPSTSLAALDIEFPIQKDRPRNYFPALLFSPSTLPVLWAISAPFFAITSLCSSRNIVKLDIPDEAVLTSRYKAFVEVHSDLLMVQEFSLFIGDWDDELMLAIIAHFPNYTSGMQGEGQARWDIIIGMGSCTLYALPHFVSIHIFCITLPPPSQNFLETNNLTTLHGKELKGPPA
ncbi:hypothetical protein BD769DRAFT_1739291 [Suillus cothurnatus]|nr:hypothetical protein BD769DRAFT_1739291 [Suillus cothurnatus]